MSFRAPKLLKAARDQPCVWCGAVGTTVAAHSGQVRHGSGTGIKAPDYYVAYVCQRCHDAIDGRAGHLTKEERQQMWEWAFIRTVAVWFRQGIVVVK